MGNDTSVVNAARVSFGNSVTEITEKDHALIKYLAIHNHWSPFTHTSITVRCIAPTWLARQLVKHQVGGSWNEVSRRYVDYEPSFHVPNLQMRPDGSIKQGCANSICAGADEVLETTSKRCLAAYQELLASGVAPECARMVLPLNTMTEWVWTGSLYFFFRVFKQRSDEHAQLGAQEFAGKLSEVIEPLYPISWGALKNVR